MAPAGLPAVDRGGDLRPEKSQRRRSHLSDGVTRTRPPRQPLCASRHAWNGGAENLSVRGAVAAVWSGALPGPPASTDSRLRHVGYSNSLVTGGMSIIVLSVEPMNRRRHALANPGRQIAGG
jgi:hypothetical protein